MIADLPTLTPRLVIRATDVEHLFAGLADEHAALEAELLDLLLEWDALKAVPGSGWDVDESLVAAATDSLDHFCVARRTAALATFDSMVMAAEHAAVESVAAAEAEASRLLAEARAEVCDRLVSGVGGASILVPSPTADPTPMTPSLEAAAPPSAAALIRPELAARVDDLADGEGDLQKPEGEPELFHAFWSEQDDVAATRAVIAAPLMAIAPMALALLVITLVLMLFV